MSLAVLPRGRSPRLKTSCPYCNSERTRLVRMLVQQRHERWLCLRCREQFDIRDR